MFELPEVQVLVQQMRPELRGREIVSSFVSESRPKFLFISPEPEVFDQEIVGQRIVEIDSAGKWIFVRFERGLTLIIGEFGGRLLLCPPWASLPKKHHWIGELDDGSTLALTIQLWGFVGVLSDREIAAHPCAGTLGPSPLDRSFTADQFTRRLDSQAAERDVPVKAFLTHEPNICGIGNGYLQDILFRARLSPKRKIGSLTPQERESLHASIVSTLRQAVSLGGRDTEIDLYGEHGAYTPLLDKRTAGKPCPDCGTPIEKIHYLGGSCYVCPNCQI
ncbi:hypothetical protein JW848_00850 [Candidatus Bipolaricaulota bacterium]|nr:hypothetical protein [Candidatus Bipolaricaulota bacterium]